jgi:CyaY protein
MTESEFFTHTNQLFATIETKLDAIDAEIEYSTNEGVLEIELPNQEQIIINRHMINQEVWVASKAGGFHYRFDGQHWCDTRTQSELLQQLMQYIALQLAA